MCSEKALVQHGPLCSVTSLMLGSWGLQAGKLGSGTQVPCRKPKTTHLSMKNDMPCTIVTVIVNKPTDFL